MPNLGSLSFLGASDEQLKNIYESSMRRYTDKHEPSPHEITNDNWRKSIGDKQFCEAYRDFFDAELPTQSDWKNKFFGFLLDDTDGLILIDKSFDSLIHPIIHLGYAIELNSRSVACEALTMTVVCVNSYYETPTNLKPPTNGTKPALQIVKDIRADDYVPTVDEPFHITFVLNNESVLLSHYNEWQMPEDCDKAIEELFDMAVYIYGATHKPNQIDFDFVLLHLLTGMTAIRKLRPYLDSTTIKRLLRSFFYLSIAIYIAQRRPKVNERLIDDYKDEETRYNWEYVVDHTLHTKLATEPHVVKIIHSLKDAEKDYGSKDGLYLKTALKSVDHLNIASPYNYYKSHEPWIGMEGANRELNVKH